MSRTGRGTPAEGGEGGGAECKSRGRGRGRGRGGRGCTCAYAQQVAEVVVGVKTDPLYAGVEHEAAAHEQLAEVLHVDAVAAARGGMR